MIKTILIKFKHPSNSKLQCTEKCQVKYRLALIADLDLDEP